MKTTAFGYAHHVEAVEEGKPKALANLVARFADGTARCHPRTYTGDDGIQVTPSTLLSPEGHMVDVSKVIYHPYRHGGELHVMAIYEFDYPEAS